MKYGLLFLALCLSLCCVWFKNQLYDYFQPPSRRLYFIHIPKTGGTSLHTLLENEIDLKDLYPPRRHQKVDRPVSHQLVSGHFPYWFCKQLDPQFDQAFKITILRNPIDRYLSCLRYKQKVVPHLQKLDLQSIHNTMCAEPHLVEEATPNRICRFLASDPNLTGRELLENAKKSLDTFGFVLFLENFAEDLQELCKVIGVDLEQGAQPHLNTTAPQEISAEFMAIVKKHTELDAELYEYAKTHLKRKNTTYQFKPHDPLPPKITKINYTFSMPLRGSNWCYRENVDQFSRKHRIYRWVMDKPAKIFFNLAQNQDYNLQFSAQVLTADTLPHVLVNGIEIPVKKQKNSSFSKYQCFIPKELISDKMTEFTFFSPKSYKYNEIHPGCDDDRKLSFALNGITIDKF